MSKDFAESQTSERELFPVLRGMPATAIDDASISLASELSSRPSRPADHEAENRALTSLMRELAISPQSVLQKLAEVIVELCDAHSAGISLLDDTRGRFYWPAIAGKWATYVGGGTPRDFGPCGMVLDRNSPLMFSRPQRLFPYLADGNPQLEDVLLFPFYVDGKAVGTIWAVTHDQSKQFDSEDARVMANLTEFATTAHQAFRALEAANEAVEANQRLASIVGNSDDAIISKNLDGTITSWNSGAERLFGYSASEAIGKNVRMLIPADLENEEPRIIERISSGERIDHYDTVRVRKDGSLVQVSLSVSPVKNAANKIVGASKIARDIGERKGIERTKEILLNEMKHRVKNNLATVQSLVSQTFRRAPKEEKDAFSSRLHALASSHDLLTDQNWARAFLGDIVEKALAPFIDAHSDRYRVRGPKVWINATNALMVGMAMHELATNAAKYGALSNDAGIVDLSWEQVSEASSDSVRVCWKEAGGPLVTIPKRTGFGSALIKSAFGGDGLVFDYKTDGVMCSFVVPLDRPSEGAQI
jgi:PAS domain S-box-containing protein